MSAKVLNVLILLGSNSEDAAKVLTQARAELAQRVPVRREGSLWCTAAWGFEGPDFLNQVLEVQWSGEPMALLEMVLEVERSLGRVRDAQGPRYASRSIDIDLLLTQPFLALATPQLELPHPRMPMRRFVLQPVAEFWREWQADASGASVGDLLDRCSDQNDVHLHSNLNDHDL
ncbi:MAG: 2-amino-4-hydroxy-6-hydroxymethyldihydropteridine diphosphokinase [Bacteroidota bacterium]